jgi:hypothetical protein
MSGAGAGYNVNDWDSAISKQADLCVTTTVSGADLQRSLTRLLELASLHPVNCTDAEAAAVLVTVFGGVDILPTAKALLWVQAIRQMSYWCGLFAPTVTLDVRGPSSLL